MSFFCRYFGVRVKDNKITHEYIDGRFTSFVEARDWIYKLKENGTIKKIIIDNERRIAGENEWGEVIQIIELPEEIRWYADGFYGVKTTYRELQKVAYGFIEFRNNIFLGFHCHMFFSDETYVDEDVKKSVYDSKRYCDYLDNTKYGNIYFYELPYLWKTM